MTDHLAKEIETFDRILPSLLKDEGKYAVIQDASLLGVFESYADALTAGYTKAGIDNFLVKRIAAIASISYFTRELDGRCHM